MKQISQEDAVLMRQLLADCAGIVRVQNGNKHADINDMLAKVEAVMNRTDPSNGPA